MEATAAHTNQYNENGECQGLWRYWHQNGRMLSEGHYESGLKEGEWQE